MSLFRVVVVVVVAVVVAVGFVVTVAVVVVVSLYLYLVSLREGRLVRNGMLRMCRTRRVTRILPFFCVVFLLYSTLRCKTVYLDIDIGLSIR